jgi:hypothetical protein
MFHRQEFASKIQRVQGPLWDFHGNCDRFEGLKVYKSRFSVPYVASVVGPMNYRGQRITFSRTKRKTIFIFYPRMFFTSTELPGPVVFGWEEVITANCPWISISATNFTVQLGANKLLLYHSNRKDVQLVCGKESATWSFNGLKQLHVPAGCQLFWESYIMGGGSKTSCCR